MLRRRALFAVAFLNLAAAAFSQVQTIPLPSPIGASTQIDRDWRFSKGDFSTAAMPAFEDAAWRVVDLPHDWSIEGPFGPDYASGTGYAPGGIGWYRKHFCLDTAVKGNLVSVEFDGV